eukprot:c6048_g1_i2.p1 GENE.c6048_g1_i2~~c6048_g1_i2.p1  ORF type:complete len:344 (-),score=76.07 c6048_g1_i2:46-1077(-)
MDVQPFVSAPEKAPRKAGTLSKRMKALILVSVCCAAVVCAALLATSSSNSFASTASADKNQLVSRAADDELEFGIDDWQVVVQQSALMIAGEIPYAGPIIGFFLALFWPSSQVDVWALIKDRVLELVTQELLKQEIRTLQNDLEGLRDSLTYVKNSGLHEKGNFMDSLIIVSDQTWAHIRGSSDPKHMLPIFAPFAYIQLGILNERYRCGSILFPTDHNESGWKNDLLAKHTTLTTWFAKTYQEWYDWRIPLLGFDCERQVSCAARFGCTCGFRARFEDRLLGTHEEERINCQEGTSRTFCARMQTKHNERVAAVVAEMEKKIVYARHLDVFLPTAAAPYCAY